MFEEAAGISRYRYRRQEAERKLQGAEENLVRPPDIQTELESRVGPLKTRSDKAERFLALSEEKKGLGNRALARFAWRVPSDVCANSSTRLIWPAVNIRRPAAKWIVRPAKALSSSQPGCRRGRSPSIPCRRTASGLEEEAARTEGEIAVARERPSCTTTRRWSVRGASGSGWAAATKTCCCRWKRPSSPLRKNRPSWKKSGPALPTHRLNWSPCLRRACVPPARWRGSTAPSASLRSSVPFGR